MVKKVGKYIIPLELEDVWKRTLEFWAEHRGIVIDQHLSTETGYRTLIIKHKTTAFSWGEIYKMKLGYNYDNLMTYVHIEISLAVGGGLQWLKPKSLLTKWAQSMGIPPAKLERKAG